MNSCGGTEDLRISIHAPLSGSDTPERRVRDRTENFNPRSPHRERRAPRRGWCEPIPHFNPRSPHRERQLTILLPPHPAHFNPRSPHRERPDRLQCVEVFGQFQSTLPSQGATAVCLCDPLRSGISIHAPLTGSDN